MGPDYYDRWANHTIPFDDPGAVAALTKVGVLAHSEGYVFPDPSIIDDRTMLEALVLASRPEPQCLMILGPSWFSLAFEDAPMVAAPFPTIDPEFAPAMEGGGDIAIVMSDRPEVRAVVRAMASPAWGRPWAEADDLFVAPHRGFDLDAYNDPWERSLATAVGNAIETGTYRFDASDQLPFDIANSHLHAALVDYVTDPAASAEATLGLVEDAWTEFENSDPEG
jgi:alpha-glucoside transport system substrate-binding protein